MNTINIAIADDHCLIIEGLTKILMEFERIGEIRSASNGKELLKLLKVYKPDVILLDIQMPVMDGIEACKKIANRFPLIKILGLTQHAEEYAVNHLIGAGAHGYLLKNTKPNELFKAISWIVEHDFYMNELTQNSFIKSSREEFNKRNHSPEIDFTEREIKMLKYISMEKSSNEMAELLNLSNRTIDKSRSKLIKKLGVRSSIGVTRYAVENGYHLM